MSFAGSTSSFSKAATRSGPTPPPVRRPFPSPTPLPTTLRSPCARPRRGSAPAQARRRGSAAKSGSFRWSCGPPDPGETLLEEKFPHAEEEERPEEPLPDFTAIPARMLRLLVLGLAADH